MQCRVMKPFNRNGELQLPGSIIKVPEEALVKLAGYVQPLSCQARKVGGRVCNAPLREGVNGFLSCSDMFCQVPYKRHQGAGTGGNSRF